MKNFDTEIRMTVFLAKRDGLLPNEFQGIPAGLANALNDRDTVLGKITESMYPNQSYEITIRIQAVEE